MKRISMLALVALAAVALSAAIGSAAASATVLCKSATTVCAHGNSYGVGTEISGQLPAGGSVLFQDSSGNTWSKCSGSTIKEQVTDAGGSGPVKSKTLSYGMSGCSFITTFPSLGTWEVSSTGSNNGKVTSHGMEMLWKFSGLTCYYKVGENFGEIKGGASPTLSVNTILTTGNSGCPVWLQMTSSYEITSPTPIYVEGSEAPALPISLCKANGEHCEVANRYGNGTKVSASLNEGSPLEIKDTSGNLLDSCKTGSLSGEVLSAGGGTEESALVNFSSASVSSCTFTTFVENLGWEGVLKRSETQGNGTLTLNKFRLRANTVLFGQCTYGGSPVFQFTGGAPAQFSAKSVAIERQGTNFACPLKAVLSGAFTVSAPNPLYLTAP